MKVRGRDGINGGDEEEELLGLAALYPAGGEELDAGSTLREPAASYSSPTEDRNGLRRETYKLALEAVRVSALLRSEKHFELASQFLRSGTAPGTLVAEYFFAESDRDSRHKLKIALKEANEFRYWTCLFRDSKLLSAELADPLLHRANTVLSTLKVFYRRHESAASRGAAGS